MKKIALTLAVLLGAFTVAAYATTDGSSTTDANSQGEDSANLNINTDGSANNPTNVTVRAQQQGSQGEAGTQ
jgi:hypothetical protein